MTADERPSLSKREGPRGRAWRSFLLLSSIFYLLTLLLTRLLLDLWAPFYALLLTALWMALYETRGILLKDRGLSGKYQNSKAYMRRTDRLAMLGTLTAGLAHEIRNPLVSIKTYFQLLPEKYQDQEFRERFQKVAAGEVDRISRLVEELLEFSRPSDPDFRPVNMQQLIEEVVTLLESTARARGVELKEVFGEENPPDVLCDPEQIKQVLLNLAHNAFDAANGQGVVLLRTRYDPIEDPSGFVHIEVEDNGLGMTPEEIEKLFTPFYTTKTSGTGLGLAISRQIVEEHLGTISAKSRYGEGSTFYLRLPQKPPLHERRKRKNRLNRQQRKEMVH
jgi:signal transduction histidine kinase